MKIGGTKAHCLLDTGCEGVMVAADYARAAGLRLRKLAKPVTLQLACQGSKSMINHGLTAPINVAGQNAEEYFDVANIDYYDAILGVPFLRRFKITLNFGTNEILVGSQSYKPGDKISPGETKPL